MIKMFGAAAAVSFAVFVGSPLHATSCCLNRAKAETVVRAQRQQAWRYALMRTSYLPLARI